MNRPSGSFDVLMLGLTLDVWEWICDGLSSVTMYSNESGNASVNATDAADAPCVHSLTHSGAVLSQLTSLLTLIVIWTYPESHSTKTFIGEQ